MGTRHTPELAVPPHLVRTLLSRAQLEVLNGEGPVLTRGGLIEGRPDLRTKLGPFTYITEPLAT